MLGAPIMQDTIMEDAALTETTIMDWKLTETGSDNSRQMLLTAQFPCYIFMLFCTVYIR